MWNVSQSPTAQRSSACPCSRSVRCPCLTVSGAPLLVAWSAPCGAAGGLLSVPACVLGSSRAAAAVVAVIALSLRGCLSSLCVLVARRVPLLIMQKPRPNRTTERALASKEVKG